MIVRGILFHCYNFGHPYVDYEESAHLLICKCDRSNRDKPSHNSIIIASKWNDKTMSGQVDIELGELPNSDEEPSEKPRINPEGSERYVNIIQSL